MVATFVLKMPRSIRQRAVCSFMEMCFLHFLHSSSMRSLSYVFVLLLQEPQPIDWEYYRKGIGSKVVDMYKQAYESKHLYITNLI